MDGMYLKSGNDKEADGSDTQSRPDEMVASTTITKEVAALSLAAASTSNRTKDGFLKHPIYCFEQGSYCYIAVSGLSMNLKQGTHRKHLIGRGYCILSTQVQPRFFGIFPLRPQSSAKWRARRSFYGQSADPTRCWDKGFWASGRFFFSWVMSWEFYLWNIRIS